MKESNHVIVSVSLGALVWFFSRSLTAGLLCFLSGIFLDVDHAIEYVVHHGWRSFSYKRCCLACEQTKRQEGEYQFKKVYFIFHVAEVVPLLWFLTCYTKNVYLLASALGYSTHLILDCIANWGYLRSYFIIWRAINKFYTDRIYTKKL